MNNRTRWEVLPLKRSPTGLLTVTVSIDGWPFILVVDTGANATVLDRVRAQSRGLVGVESDQGAIGCVTVDGVEVLNGQSLLLGSVKIESPRLIMVDLGHVNVQLEKTGAELVDGVLGADILSAHDAEIAYLEPELRLRLP